MSPHRGTPPSVEVWLCRPRLASTGTSPHTARPPEWNVSRIPSTRFQSVEYRLPKALEAAIKTPVREAVDEALADASVTIEADETDSDASGEGSTDETDTDSASSASTTDDASQSGSRSWRRRGLLGLGVLVPVAALAAFAQSRRGDGLSSRAEAIVTVSGDGHDEEADVEDGTDADPIPRSAPGVDE